MAAPTSATGASTIEAQTLFRRYSPGALLLVAAVPFLFLHAEYQPGVEVGEIGIETADVLVAAVAVACLAAPRPWPLRPTLAIWVAAAALLGWIGAAIVYGRLLHDEYPVLTSAVTAAKFAEYGVLALAVPLLLRTRAELELLVGVLVAWSVAMTTVGLLQFVGWLDALESAEPLRRKPSYVGNEDFPALSAAALCVAFGAIALGSRERRERLVAPVAAATGVVGVIVGGALAGALATVIAAAGVAAVSLRRGLLTMRRGLALAALTAAVVAGVGAMRTGDVADYLAFLGIGEKDEPGDVETYSHRTLLAYIGLRIWADEPLLGVGWQGSSRVFAYGPHLDDAREQFPDLPAQAFPAPEHEWGVHNGYVQALADMGVPGLLVLLAPFAAGLALAWRVAAARGASKSLLLASDGVWRGDHVALLGGSWLLVVAAAINARGLVAGVPADALLWLALGLVAAAAARSTRAA